ncbi:MAG: HDOD domain-containing protein [Planctomycetes bacterium]|nr:HDOD domain-containing protein [Planctomycetota bacterium]MCB9890501.1 HDOD domain-containing protein [Planctomycetota bacterium]MCB9917742.1 HDOD domain-containing protein [Planctomycetota bacterium]
MSRTKILFVDDEPDLLKGLELSLRKYRHEWDMLFVEGAAQAWPNALAGVDIVVTDFRMPGMDGAEFLNLVREHHPGTTRIVLSGHADQGLAFDAMEVAHAWLHKPSPTPVIVDTIRRAVRARIEIEDEHLLRIVFGARAVPSYPRRYAEIQRVLQDSSSSTDMIADSIAGDPGLASKLLQLSNSPLFSRSIPVASVRDALCVLGLETFAQLVLVTEVFDVFDRLRKATSPEATWLEDRAMRLSMMMKELFVDPRDTATAATIGAIHDIGILMLLQNEIDYAAVDKALEHGTMTRAAAEIATYGFSHGEVAAALARVWGLPPAIVDALSQHERLGKNPAGILPMALGLKISEGLLEGDGDIDGDSDAEGGLADLMERFGEVDPEAYRRATRNAPS